MVSDKKVILALDKVNFYDFALMDQFDVNTPGLLLTYYGCIMIATASFWEWSLMMLQLVLFCLQMANLDEIIMVKTHVGDWPWVLPCA